MGFTLVKPASTGKINRNYRLIKNSEVIKVGDAITDESTGAANVDALTEEILGFATAIVTAKRVSLESATVTTADYDGTWDVTTKSYTASADNETDKMVMVEYVKAEEGDRFKATLSAAKGSTTGSNKEGYYIGIKTNDSSKLDETTASTSSANTQFIIRDPLLAGSTTEVVVEVALRQSTN